MAAPVTAGAMKNPWNIRRKFSKVAPSSLPDPTLVSRLAIFSMRSLRPTTYPPVCAMPPPAFLISDPTLRQPRLRLARIVSENSP